MKLDSSFGSKTWFVADGWLPDQSQTDNSGYEGHEAIMILNCQEKDAEIQMDVYFENEPPLEKIHLSVPAKRIRCFRMDHPDEIGGLKIDRRTQYALRFQSDIEVIIQYGRMDVTQSNLAYIGMMGMPA